MMLTKTKAIVLKTIKYSDDKVIVDMLTLEMGRLSFLVKWPKNSAKAKVKRSYFMPMTVLEVEFDLRPHIDLLRLAEVRVERFLYDLAANPAKLSVALFLAEFLTYATRKEQANEALFNYIVDGMTWLNEAQAHYANFHLVMMTRMSFFIGFFPNIEDYRQGCLFDLRSGCFVDAIPSHPDILTGEEADMILTLLRVDYQSMHLLKLTREQRNRCVDVILMYYRLHVADFPAMRSLDVVRRLF